MLTTQGYYTGCQRIWIPKLSVNVPTQQKQQTLCTKEHPEHTGINNQAGKIASTYVEIKGEGPLSIEAAIGYPNTISKQPIANNPTGSQEACRNAKGKEKIEEFGSPQTIEPKNLHKVLPITPILQINDATVPTIATTLSQVPLHKTDASLRNWATLSFRLQTIKLPWAVAARIKSVISS